AAMFHHHQSCFHCHLCWDAEEYFLVPSHLDCVDTCIEPEHPSDSDLLSYNKEHLCRCLFLFHQYYTVRFRFRKVLQGLTIPLLSDSSIQSVISSMML